MTSLSTNLLETAQGELCRWEVLEEAFLDTLHLLHPLQQMRHLLAELRGSSWQLLSEKQRSVFTIPALLYTYPVGGRRGNIERCEKGVELNLVYTSHGHKAKDTRSPK